MLNKLNNWLYYVYIYLLTYTSCCIMQLVTVARQTATACNMYAKMRTLNVKTTKLIDATNRHSTADMRLSMVNILTMPVAQPMFSFAFCPFDLEVPKFNQPKVVTTWSNKHRSVEIDPFCFVYQCLELSCIADRHKNDYNTLRDSQQCENVDNWCD